MHTLTIEYPSELLGALQQEPQEFEADARLLLALKLYEIGRLSTGLAARLAGMPRSAFIFLLGRHGLSPFGQSADELKEDSAILQDWLQRRAAGAAETVSLDDLERELLADGCNVERHVILEDSYDPGTTAG